MLDDKRGRISAVVPNLMGFDPASVPATYYAFFDPDSGTPWSTDGLPVHAALHPNFTWPDPS